MSVDATTLISSIGWTLLHFVWQGTLVGCVTALALIALRNASPRQRYAVACAGLLLCLAWPALELVGRLSGTSAGGASMLLVERVRTAAQTADTALPGWLQAKLPLLVIGWAACSAALALRLALGLLWIGRVAKHQASDPYWQARLSSMALAFGVTREVRLRIVDNLSSPITAGWWRPVVLLPASLVSGMPPDLLEALLAHEMGHVKRFDYLVNLGQNLVETLLFYHPAVWWISGRIRAEREQIADDVAASHLGEPRRLALALSELERLQFSHHHLAQGANGGDLMSRIKRLIRPDAQVLNWKAAIPVLGLAAACVAGCAQTTVALPAQASAGPIVPALVQFASCKKPHYPSESLKNKHTGTVTLGYLVDAHGRAVDSKVHQSSGYEALDTEARDAIARCLFKPASQGGQPVQAWMKMKYVWTLE